jgi:hypothetical protein
MTEAVTNKIIPAQPGWYVACLVGEALELHPVIAWTITRWSFSNKGKGNDEDDCFYHRVRPLTICGDWDNVGNEWGYKGPDGKYIDDYDEHDVALYTERDMIERLKGYQKHKRERAAAAAVSPTRGKNG